MEIKYEKKSKLKYFDELSLGDVFAFEERIFMKIGTDKDDYYNAVDVKCGVLEKFEEDDSIVPLVVQLHILREG